MKRLIHSLASLVMVLVGGISFAEPHNGSSSQDARFPQRYSYFSPTNGTVNRDNTKFEPQLFTARGRPLSDDFLVLTSFSRTLARISPEGRPRWLLDLKGGGGAYGLSMANGYAIVCFDSDLLFIEPQSGRVAARIRILPPGSEAALNMVRVQGRRIVIADSHPTPNAQILIGQLDFTADGRPKVSIIDRIQTEMAAPRDALFLAPDLLAVADTFGNSVAFYWRTGAGWRIGKRLVEYYPNMLDWRDGRLTVLSEHANRLINWDLDRNRGQVLLSCPAPLFSDWRTRPQQIQVEEPRTRSNESPPRQICSADIAGDQTLYAPNGFFDEGNGRIWVADADNHRVALFVDGQFWGAITGINHPVRVIPFSQLH
ncbi:hypothetical protein ACS5PK_03960 [Roseateles sp. DB2]|uniref:hypothetical protein n=1 Tax=Roseateles sp. DB2 TaxID=3453717 RepID=UPI003EED0D23